MNGGLLLDLTSDDGVTSDWLLLMLAVANSTLITRYYDAVYHNKLYSGRRRFMTHSTSAVFLFLPWMGHAERQSFSSFLVSSVRAR